MTDEADYMLDHYGTCAQGPRCACLKPGHAWLGRSCPQWKPIGAKSPEEMFQLLRAAHDG